ncbi:MAG TPA: chondroitinase-B domain-containing protein, partial [Luteitalea sp.]|nr:chondroitinase-B domain-containing protein [Luteitalea sp.]
MSGALTLGILFLGAAMAQAQQTWHVAPGGGGTGTAADPFGRIQDGLKAAQPGDTILIARGTYAESLQTVRAGAQGLPITLKARDGARSVLVSRAAQVLSVGHADITVDGIVFDANYAPTDAVRIASSGDRLTLRSSEVRRSGRDCIDMSSPEDVLIEDTIISGCLWWNG